MSGSSCDAVETRPLRPRAAVPDAFSIAVTRSSIWSRSLCCGAQRGNGCPASKASMSAGTTVSVHLRAQIERGSQSDGSERHGLQGLEQDACPRPGSPNTPTAAPRAWGFHESCSPAAISPSPLKPERGRGSGRPRPRRLRPGSGARRHRAACARGTGSSCHAPCPGSVMHICSAWRTLRHFSSVRQSSRSPSSGAGRRAQRTSSVFAVRAEERGPPGLGQQPHDVRSNKPLSPANASSSGIRFVALPCR